MTVIAYCENNNENGNKTREFIYKINSEDISFQELYLIIDEDMMNSGSDIRSVTRIPYIVIEEEKREPYETASVEQFTKKYYPDSNELIIHINYGGIGASLKIEGRIRFEIREKEPAFHEPHIHISIQGRETSIRIGKTIEECTVESNEKNWAHYKSKDRKDILKLITTYYEELLSFYNDQKEQLIKPRTVELTFRKKHYYLSHGSSISME